MIIFFDKSNTATFKNEKYCFPAYCFENNEEFYNSDEIILKESLENPENYIKAQMSGMDIDNFANQELITAYNIDAGKVSFILRNEIKEEQAKSSLDKFKAFKINQAQEAYQKASILHIHNAFVFDVDLSSNDGKILLEIIQRAIAGYDFSIQAFTITIPEGDSTKTIRAEMYNWLWKYLLAELLDYKLGIDNLLQNYIWEIQKINDILTLEAFKICFPKPDGITINVSEIVRYLMEKSQDEYTNQPFPKEIKDAIARVNRELFSYVNHQTLLENATKISWFY